MIDRLATLAPWIAALIVLLIAAPGIAQAVVAVIALVLVPGWALSVFLLPRNGGGPVPRVLTAIGLGIAIAIAVGLVLSVTPFGTRLGPVVLLLAAAGLLAAAVTGRLPAPRSIPFDISAGQLRMLGVAVVLMVTSLGIARASTAFQRPQELVELWAVPATGNEVRLGITNSGSAAGEFRLVVMQADNPIEEWPDLRVEPGDTWEDVLTDLPAADVRAVLYEQDGPNAPFREVVLAAPAAPE